MKTSDAKAISLWQPYCSLIGFGLKHFETRSWKTKYRGILVICSAKKKTIEQRQLYETLAQKYSLNQSWDSLPFGKACVVCKLTDCILITQELIHKTNQTEIDCGDWTAGRYAWKLDRVRIIQDPYPVKGQQGLWNLRA